ncbi:hypothetical protein Drorol1_Dr00000654 [Drosera rotundifolia]
MKQQDTESLVEERQQTIFTSSFAANPTHKIAHFLKSSKPINPFDPKPKITKTHYDESFHSKLKFEGWRNPLKQWKAWVDRLLRDHGTLWKELGIHGAIMSSTHRFPIDHGLILCVVDKWCPVTNTFVFPWGEATITLEDVVVLGGFPVLGDESIFSASKCLEMEEKLNEMRSKISRSKAKKPAQSLWLKGFMESESKMDHEAFLTLWLSRFVFPQTRDVIQKSAFGIAVRLARGTRIALAQPVLAHLYRDLSLLKEKLEFLSEEGRDHVLEFTPMLQLWGIFHLVQLWVWERFPALSPRANALNPGDPRSARWNNVKVCRAENVKLDSFLWRPYAKTLLNWSLPGFYREKGGWVLMKNDTDKDTKLLFLFLTGAELVGFDCKREYSPCRVSRQFGLDQDLPHKVVVVNVNKRDVKLYVPSRQYEPGITASYHDWLQENVDECSPDGPKISRKLFIEPKVEAGNGDDDVPPGFKRKITIIEIEDSSDDDDNDDHEDHLLLSEVFGLNPVKIEKETNARPESPCLSYSEADNGPLGRLDDHNDSRETKVLKSPSRETSEGSFGFKHGALDTIVDVEAENEDGDAMRGEEVMSSMEVEHGNEDGDASPGFKRKIIIDIDDSFDDDDDNDDHVDCLLLSESFVLRRVKLEQKTILQGGLNHHNESRKSGEFKTPALGEPSEGDFKHQDEIVMDDGVENKDGDMTKCEEILSDIENAMHGSGLQSAMDFSALLDKLDGVIAMLKALIHRHL